MSYRFVFSEIACDLIYSLFVRFLVIPAAGNNTATCAGKQPCKLSKHQRNGRSNLHGENMEITVPLVHSSRGYSHLLRCICMHNKSHNLHLILGLNYVYILTGAGTS